MPQEKSASDRSNLTSGNLQVDKTGLSSPTKLEWMIIVFGGALRLTQFLSNRSLWLDEAKLALNIVNRSFVQLFKPLDYGQGAPVGFLMLERSAVHLFGSGEYALRFFPFLSGMISLLLFYRLAKQSVLSGAVPIALGLFATSAPLIYYSSEVKQYSGDVAVALLLWSAAIYYATCRLTLGRVLTFGLLGAVVLWFSHPATFVLAGIGMSLVLFCPAEDRWERARKLSITFAMWGLSLGACYLLFLRHLSADQSLLSYWNFSFPPAHLFSVAGVEWFALTFFAIFQNPVGLELSGIAAFAFLVGCLAMVSAKRQTLAILISPVLVTLLAASFHKYPFNGRLLLFAVPALLIPIAEGVEYIRRHTSVAAPAVGACLIAVLFFYPVLFSSYHLFKPSLREEIKPVLNYFQSHAREGDLLYVHSDAIAAFQYYAPRLRLSNVHVIQGVSSGDPETSGEMYEKDIDRLRGHNRVWLVLAPGASEAGDNEKKLFLYFIGKEGTTLDNFQRVGAAVYLYDLDRPPPGS
jgi:hypothetical protein